MKKISGLSIVTSILFLLITTLLLIALVHEVNAVTQAQHNAAFQKFVSQIRTEALARGISPHTVNKYLTNLNTPVSRVLHGLSHQPQDILTFKAYAKSFVSQHKIDTGKKLFKKYRTLLKKIEEQYQVPAEILVAVWGAESNYGQQTGKKPLIAALVTLSFQKHREQFYRHELFAALKILNKQKIPNQAYSTFDGGMGQPSFMPSAYFNYAVDYDQDGFANIWTSVPDSLASIANYLQKNGWKYNRPWVAESNVPPTLPKTYFGRSHALSLTQWATHGVTALNQPNDFTQRFANYHASLLVPDKNTTLGYLVFYNFKVLLRWNNDTFECLSIGLLANQIKLAK